MRGVGCLCLTDECRGFMFCVVAFMYARVLDVCSIVCLRALEAGGGGLMPKNPTKCVTKNLQRCILLRV